MGAGIARMRDQSLERPTLDVLGELQVHCAMIAVPVGQRVVTWVVT
jgi:hypothetical protein